MIIFHHVDDVTLETLKVETSDRHPGEIVIDINDYRVLLTNGEAEQLIDALAKQVDHQTSERP